MPRKKVLGILGGMGPAAGAYFFSLVTSHTKATCDSDHLDAVLASLASTPDRTDFILGKSTASPVEAMKKGVRLLCAAGAEVIAIPCNTACVFSEELCSASTAPIINTVRETSLFALKSGARKVGILATDGTIFSGIYRRECSRCGIFCVFPSPSEQLSVNDIIYGAIKSSSLPDSDKLNAVLHSLFSQGCDSVILGCTELSLVPKEKLLRHEKIIDSLSVLARTAILLCGGTPKGFDAGNF